MVYYFSNRKDSLGVNYSSSKTEDSIPVYFMTRKEDISRLQSLRTLELEKIDNKKKEIYSEMDFCVATITAELNKEVLDLPAIDILIRRKSTLSGNLNNLILEENSFQDIKSEIPENSVLVSKDVYEDLLKSPDKYVIDSGLIREVTVKEKSDKDKEKLDKEEELNNSPEKIRSERAKEFSLFDKYHFERVQRDENLSESQLSEFDSWREAWRKAPETKVRPQRPSWFRL